MKDKEQAINGVKSEQIFLQEKQNPVNLFLSINMLSVKKIGQLFVN